MTRPERRPGNASSILGALRDLIRTRQVRRIGGVALGTASAQAALVLASPILSRIYSPADFGTYAYFFAALGFLTPIATLRYELAIPVPGSTEEARDVGLTALSVAFGVGAALGLLLWLLGHGGFGVAIDSAGFGWFLYGLPVGVCLAGVHQTLTYWAVRHQRFRSVAWSRGGSGISTALTQIPVGLFRTGPTGLFIGDLAGRAVGGLLLVRSVARTIPTDWRSVSVGALFRSAVRYRGFPLLSAPSALLNGVALFLPLVAIGSIYGATTAGWMFMAQRLIALPTALLSSATSQVYVAEFARLDVRAQRLLYRDTLMRVGAMSGVPFLVGALAAPALFPIILGSDWTAAGVLAMILAPFHFFQLLSGSTVSTLDILQLHGVRLVREAALLAMTVAVFATGYLVELDPTRLIAAYSAVGSMFYVVSIAWVRGILARRDR